METEKIPLSLIYKALKSSNEMRPVYLIDTLLVAFDSETELINFYNRDTDIIVARFPY